MEGVTHALLHRAIGGDQGLSDHLSAEHALPAHIRAVTAKQVHLDLLEIEQVDQVLDWILVGLLRSVGHGHSWGKREENVPLTPGHRRMRTGFRVAGR